MHALVKHILELQRDAYFDDTQLQTIKLISIKIEIFIGTVATNAKGCRLIN